MTTTCRCGVCGLRWFRCTCPDSAPDHMAPESTWAFWRNMTKQDVEAYMDRIAEYERMRLFIERKTQQMILRGLYQ